MFMDLKTKYSHEGNSPQIDRYIQCDPDQNLSSLVYTDNLFLNYIWKCKGCGRTKAIWTKEDRCWRTYAT